MIYLLIGLFAFAVILLIASAFAQDPYKTIREEIDQLSIQHIQEMYIIKKKLKILEEELLVSDIDFHQASDVHLPSNFNEKREIHEIIKNQVRSLAHQGLTIDQIARQSSLTPSEVETILNNKTRKG